jgi:murein DD-endopeptidase MepM/ murein hydrolase activator NlpD
MFELDNDPFGPRKSRFWKLRNNAYPKPKPWRWPLDKRGDRAPIVIAQQVTPDRRGVELGFARGEVDLNEPVYAVQDGQVMFCGETRTGYAISIDHIGYGWATYYGHLSKVHVTKNYLRRSQPRQRVRGGDLIGFAAKSPLRFELWQWTEDRGFVAVDPIERMREWTMPRRHHQPPTPRAPVPDQTRVAFVS